MRILHICQHDSPDSGGSLRVAEALAWEQRKRGKDAWILFLYGSSGHVSARFGTNIICLGLNSSRQAVRGVFSLISTVRKVKPDIIHSHDGIIWPRLAFLFCRPPVVMHTHLPLNIENSNRMSRFLLLKTTDVLVGISLHTIETWVRAHFPAHRIHYVPNGVDFERFDLLDVPAKKQLRQELGLPEQQKIILWVGRVHRGMKGSDRVERMAGLLSEDMVLVVVGSGPDYKGMAERCAPLVSAGRLILIGSTNTPEKYYQVADSYLFTSYYEPFGLVILEAVASGLPICAFPVTNGGGAVALLQEFNAHMVSDEEDDASILKVVRNMPDEQVVKKSHERAESAYSWESVTSRVEDVYQLALNKR